LLAEPPQVAIQLIGLCFFLRLTHNTTAIHAIRNNDGTPKKWKNPVASMAAKLLQRFQNIQKLGSRFQRQVLINASVLSGRAFEQGVIGAAELWRAFDKTV